MTWYASQIITTSNALVEVESDPLLSGYIFKVTNPITHAWHRPEVAHGVPPNGLVFVRPICNPNEFEAEWLGGRTNIIDWFKLTPKNDQKLRLTPSIVAEQITDFDVSLFPPAEALAFVKSIAVQSGEPVCFYYCFCWGGDIEMEFAWIFGNDETVLFNHGPLSMAHTDQIFRFTSSGLQKLPGDLLVETLRALDCELPTPFFAPHTRDFPWEKYRV